MNVYYAFILFWVFSVIGWIIEEFVCSITEKKIVNRGFLIGPYCPIYGCGGITMMFLLPFKDSPFLCFILSLVLCTIIEYITSYIMEKLFDVRWWDYSEMKFNINGRVCLTNAIGFGLLGMIAISYVYPFALNILDSIDFKIIQIIDLVILIITTIDILVSLNVMKSIETTLSEGLRGNHDATNEIKKIVKEKLSNNFLQRRLIKAYEYFSYQTREVKEKLNKIRVKFKVDNRSSYFILFGFALGIIFSIIFKNFMLCISLGILTGFILDLLIMRFKK